MSDPRHRSEGRKQRPARQYVAMVEGYDHGVPFRTFYKVMSAAERDAIKTGGVVTDLCNLSRRRWIADEWREA